MELTITILIILVTIPIAVLVIKGLTDKVKENDTHNTVNMLLLWLFMVMSLLTANGISYPKEAWYVQIVFMGRLLLGKDFVQEIIKSKYGTSEKDSQN